MPQLCAPALPGSWPRSAASRSANAMPLMAAACMLLPAHQSPATPTLEAGSKMHSSAGVLIGSPAPHCSRGKQHRGDNERSVTHTLSYASVRLRSTVTRQTDVERHVCINDDSCMAGGAI